MQPRLSTSRKWTDLPPELTKQIRSVFQQNFKERLGKGGIEADGKIFPDEILIRVGYRQEKVLKQINWDISIQYKSNKDNVLKLLHMAIDAAAALFEQAFSAEDDSEFPRKWEEVDFEGRKIYVQYNTVNPRLESEADKLLGDAGEAGLTGGAWEADEDADPEDIKKRLGVDDEEEDVPDDDEKH
jgi:hypothetical protein